MMCHRSRGPLRAHVIVLMAPMLTMASGCLISWLQFGGGDGHSSNNTSETTLTASNVSSLHRVWQANLGDTADGAPVYLLNASTPSGQMSLVFATTRGGRIVALNEATGAVVWSKTFGPGTCRINNGSTPCYTTSSPAIDPNGQYVYSYGLDGYVHKLAVSDGAETLTGGWPELVTRKGWDEKGSSALSMAKARNGVTFLYMVTAGYPGDRGDYQGHLVAIDLSTGAQKVYNTLCANQAVHFVAAPGTPDCAEVQSGVWARAGTVYDAANDRLFISTGNGQFDPTNHHWGDTVIALHPDGTGADANGDPVDSYTPTNYQQLDISDQDLGSTLPAILPTPAASNVRKLAVMGGKDAKLRLLSLDNLGGHGTGATGGEVGAIIDVPQGGQTLTQPAVWVNPADASTWVFITNDNGTSALKLVVDGAGNPSLVLQWSNTTRSTSAVLANNVLYEASGDRVGAYDPLTGANLWQDTTLGSLHWQSPIVVNGAVFMEDIAGHLNAYRR